MKKVLICLLFVGILFFIFLSIVSAFGVYMDYTRENPLHMARGEKKIVNFYLINTKDVVLNARIINGNNIAILDKMVYNLKAGERVPVNIIIKIPENANDEYIIDVYFEEKGDSNTGMVSVSQASTVSMKVIVDLNKTSSDSNILNNNGNSGKTRSSFIFFGLIALIVLLLIIILILIFINSRK